MPALPSASKPTVDGQSSNNSSLFFFLRFFPTNPRCALSQTNVSRPVQIQQKNHHSPCSIYIYVHPKCSYRVTGE